MGSRDLRDLLGESVLVPDDATRAGPLFLHKRIYLSDSASPQRNLFRLLLSALIDYQNLHGQMNPPALLINRQLAMLVLSEFGGPECEKFPLEIGGVPVLAADISTVFLVAESIDIISRWKSEPTTK